MLNITSNGELFLQDPTSACVLNGRVKIINDRHNAYDFELVHSSCNDNDRELIPFNGVTFRGLAFSHFDDEFNAYAQGTVAGTSVGYVLRFYR